MYDVVVAGGTLGVFMAAALAVRGWRVAVVEQGKLQGRKQVRVGVNPFWPSIWTQPQQQQQVQSY
jgi:2-polyprenyl-6-methoxyphenol hydroxylase-like FAD-dependent oxidoreductase